MLGIITLIIALGAQVSFLVFRMTTQNWQTKTTHFARIAAFVVFSLLMITGVYWWGYRWMGLFLLLAVLAAISVLYFARYTKKEKQYRGFRAVFSCISGCLLVSFCFLPSVLFPQFKEVLPTGSLGVNTQSVTLVDEARVDPFSQSGENRKLTVQFWYPSVAGDTDAFPLVVFSHGAFGFRGSNLSTFEDLAATDMSFAASTTATTPFTPGMRTEAARLSTWTF